MLLIFFVLLASFLFPAYAYWMLSPRGGGFQEKLWNVVIDALGPVAAGEIIDIGAGNGVLAVMVARRNPGARVLGVDYWGDDWEFSKAACEANATAAGVDGRVRFEKGDAAKLAFEDGRFDAATSNLTFHEVKTAANKRDVLVEALRVVKPGGRISFVDYFFEPSYYGDPADFATFVSELGLAEVSIRPLREVLSLSLLLRHPKVLGRVAILSGTK